MVVPIHTRLRPDMATLVPLAANAPSPGNAAGSRSDGTAVQLRPPSSVSRTTNVPSTASLTAAPCRASAKVSAS